jgi:hypothetical protein
MESHRVRRIPQELGVIQRGLGGGAGTNRGVRGGRPPTRRDRPPVRRQRARRSKFTDDEVKVFRMRVESGKVTVRSKKEQTGFSCRRPGRGPSRGARGGQDEGARRGSAWVLTAAEGRAVPGPSSGRGESRTSDGTHQRPSWGGEVAGARGGLEGRFRRGWPGRWWSEGRRPRRAACLCSEGR